MSFDERLDYKEITYLCIVVTNSLSIVSSLIIVLIYLLAKDLRVYAFKLVVYLSVFDMVKSAAMLIPTYNKSSGDYFCQIQGIFYQIFTLMSFFMALLMASSLYLCTINRYHYIEKYHKFALFSILFLSCCFAFTFIHANAYGKAGYWCWIKAEEKALRMGCFYAPLWMINLLNAVIYCKIIRKLSCEDCSMSRLRGYPFIIILCYLPATIYRVIELFNITAPYYLVLLAALADGLYGFINSICYGLTEHVKDYIADNLCFRKKIKKDELIDINSFTN